MRNLVPHAITAHTATAVRADHGVLETPYRYYTC